MTGILDGVRVLDFGRYIAGPYCAALLADLGAEVIRVEPPDGGEDRYLMPATDTGEGAVFLQANRGKQSITLDLSSPRSPEVVRRLIAQVDVVIANFSPRALKHLGLDYERLRSIKPDIILTTITAFGSEGPLSESVGFDGVGQAVSGALYLTGEPGRPYRSAASFVDFSTALASAYGTLAALIAKTRTGKGAHVEGSLAGTAMNIMNPIFIEHAAGTNIRQPTANRSPIAGPSDVFKARDGWFIMQVIGQAMFKRWARLIGRPELIDDPRFADDISRGRNGAVLSGYMAEWVAERTRDECLALLAEANVAAGPVLTPADVIGGAFGLAGAFLHNVGYPGTRGVPIARPPIRLSHGAADEMRPPPRLGEHTDTALYRFGFDANEIEELRRERVI
ncbi:MAG: CaiB/BaiF CoA transferase family protein [Candidatus Binatia bacterium]